MNVCRIRGDIQPSSSDEGEQPNDAHNDKRDQNLSLVPMPGQISSAAIEVLIVINYQFRLLSVSQSNSSLISREYLFPLLLSGLLEASQNIFKTINKLFELSSTLRHKGKLSKLLYRKLGSAAPYRK